jgi:hypothetical protein
VQYFDMVFDWFLRMESGLKWTHTFRINSKSKFVELTSHQTPSLNFNSIIMMSGRYLLTFVLIFTLKVNQSWCRYQSFI